MRCLSSLTIIVMLCGFGPLGCGSAPSNLRKPWANQALAKHNLDADNPLRERQTAKQSESPRTLDFNNSDSLNAKPKRSNTESQNLAKFDQETLTMFEEELAKMPAEERKQFYNDMITLEPAMVRQIIRARRFVHQVGQDAPTQFVTPSQMVSGEGGGIRQMSGEFPAPTNPSQQPGRSNLAPNGIGQEPARDPGLGAADPWNRKTQSHGPSASGGWTNDPKGPPAQLPFNQIPASHPAGYTAGYAPGHANPNLNANPVQFGAGQFTAENRNGSVQIQPPPGGALSPVNTQGNAVSGRSFPPMPMRNARVPNDYNPQRPPVPNYGQNGGDPFAATPPSPSRIASQNPNQRIPGTGNAMELENSFAPLPNGINRPAGKATQSSVVENPYTPQGHSDLARVIAAKEAEVAGLRYSELTEPAQKQDYIQKHIYLRMLYIMSGQSARAVTAIPYIPSADQEFWQQTFWAMSNYLDAKNIPHEDDRATQTIAQMRIAIQKLQPKARLDLRNVAFCHKITSFGNFDRFQQDVFGPGQPVLVYAEVANFHSETATQANKPNEIAYRTRLKSSIEIQKLGSAGEVVERFNFEPTEDLCHNHRQDYFHSYEFTIPQRISLGPHVMTLTVEDQLSQKVATYRLNFTVR